MRGVTLEAQCRGVERATGVTLMLVMDGGRPTRINAFDPELDCALSVSITNPSSASRCIGDMHNLIYRKRSEEVMRKQKYLCAHCNERNPLEIDHITARSKGRDDRMTNLRAVCAAFYGCQLHQKRHGG